MSRPAPTLRDLQWFQKRHNHFYHTDIDILSKSRKISHHIHHISKYSHGITDTFHEDMLANVLSIFNALNFSIGKLPTSPYIYEHQGNFYLGVNTTEIIPDIGTAVCGLCKAIEAFDHMEEYDYRGEFIKHSGSLLHYLIIKNPNILEEYLLRLTKVQMVQLFDDRYRLEIGSNFHKTKKAIFCFFEYAKKYRLNTEV